MTIRPRCWRFCPISHFSLLKVRCNLHLSFGRDTRVLVFQILWITVALKGNQASLGFLSLERDSGCLHCALSQILCTSSLIWCSWFNMLRVWFNALRFSYALSWIQCVIHCTWSWIQCIWVNFHSIPSRFQVFSLSLEFGGGGFSPYPLGDCELSPYRHKHLSLPPPPHFYCPFFHPCLRLAMVRPANVEGWENAPHTSNESQ